MKSRIKVDLDHEYVPVLKIELITSGDDVRDKMLGKFVGLMNDENFYWRSELYDGTNKAKLSCNGVSAGSNGETVQEFTLTPHLYSRNEYNDFKIRMDKEEKLKAEVERITQERIDDAIRECEKRLKDDRASEDDGLENRVPNEVIVPASIFRGHVKVEPKDLLRKLGKAGSDLEDFIINKYKSAQAERDSIDYNRPQ